MSCSWSTVLNPCNLLRALWDFAVYWWRRFQVCCSRVTSPEGAPTIDRIVAFQSQSAPSTGNMRREFSLEARHGSVSTFHDSPLSERSPTEAFGVFETISQTSRNSGPAGEQNVADPEPMPRNDQGSGQVQPDTPLLLRKAIQRSQEKPSVACGNGSNKAIESSDKSYKTFY